MRKIKCLSLFKKGKPPASEKRIGLCFEEITIPESGEKQKHLESSERISSETSKEQKGLEFNELSESDVSVVNALIKVASQNLQLFLTVLVTVLAYLINLVRYSYDIGYYHRYFHVPVEYIGSPWKTGVTDFVIFTMLGLGISWIFWGYLIKASKEKKQIWVFASGFAIFLIILAIFFLEELPYIVRYPKVIIPLLAVVSVIWVGICVALNTVLSELNAEYKDKSECRNKDKKKKRIKKEHYFWIPILVAFFMALLVCGVYGVPRSTGEEAAKGLQKLTVFITNEELNQKCPIAGENEITHYAVLYQNDDGLVAAPCKIDEKRDTAAVYTQYTCFMENKNLVVYTIEVERIYRYSDDKGFVKRELKDCLLTEVQKDSETIAHSVYFSR